MILKLNFKWLKWSLVHWGWVILEIHLKQGICINQFPGGKENQPKAFYFCWNYYLQGRCSTTVRSSHSRVLSLCQATANWWTPHSPCPNVLRRRSGGLNRHEPSISHFILSNPTYLGSLSDRGFGSTISWNGNIAIDFHEKMILKKGLVPKHTIIKWSWEWAHIQVTTNCTGAWQHGITQKTPKESMFSFGNSNMAIEILRLLR